MRRTSLIKVFLATVVACVLYPTWAFAGAKEDLSISTQGAACSGGGIAFTITNNNSTNSIQATVTQSTLASGKTTVTTLNISLQPKQQQQLGCSTQTSAGNFLTTWQVQSAQYQ